MAPSVERSEKMRLPAFEYHMPESIREALKLLNEIPGATVIAGGTDLLVRMKQGAREVKGPLVSIRRVGELRDIEFADETGLRIGAGASLSTVREKISSLGAGSGGYEALEEACRAVGAWQHREMGTIGGNLCLDTRCTYYDQPAPLRQTLEPCHKTGGDRCHVLKGANGCSATYCGDTAPAFIALGAKVTILDPNGERSLGLEEFFTGDGKRPNVLEPGQLLGHIEVPHPKVIFRESRVASAYLKLRPREAIDFPQVGVAVSIAVDRDGVCSDARIALTGVSEAPVRMKHAEEALRGVRPGREVFSAAANRVYEGTRPVQNVKGSALYRRMMARVLTERALSLAYGRLTKEEESRCPRKSSNEDNS